MLFETKLWSGRLRKRYIKGTRRQIGEARVYTQTELDKLIQESEKAALEAQHKATIKAQDKMKRDALKLAVDTRKARAEKLLPKELAIWESTYACKMAEWEQERHIAISQLGGRQLPKSSQPKKGRKPTITSIIDRLKEEERRGLEGLDIDEVGDNSEAEEELLRNMGQLQLYAVGAPGPVCNVLPF